MNFLLMAEAAGSQGGNPVVGLLIIGFVIWLACLACKPKNKGYDISHRGNTTVKPRK